MPTPASRKVAHLRPTAGTRPPNAASAAPIGVFDSGVGGLTVAAALRELLPNESIFYIGDTARVPYGGKTAQTVQRYSVEIAGMLLARQAKLIVVACNTASALAIPQLRKAVTVPVLGVIEPGAKAAVAATRNGHIGVIGTRATIRSGAYERAIRALDPDVRVTSQACPMLVPLIEEGWLDDQITEQIIARYLGKLKRSGIDTLVLGCTHYPLLAAALEKFAGAEIRLVDSAKNCAAAVKALLMKSEMSAPLRARGKLEITLTDRAGNFLKIAEEALGLRMPSAPKITPVPG